MSSLAVVGFVVAAVVVAGAVVMVLLARSHTRWLQQQSPVGVWQEESKGVVHLLEFEGGPNEGLYKEVWGDTGERRREFGHWAVNLNELRLLIMATDVPEHPQFGKDTVFLLTYPRPSAIRIDGPGRSDLTFVRAPEGTRVDVGEMEQDRG